MKHIMPFTRLEIENIIMNRVKEIHPDVTGLSVAWIRHSIVVYMDNEPKTIRERTLR